ncbi:HMG box-containing protein 4 [Patella vulgata]|uniref:HMG box-containing protein 4 n=1 Tax=Patella vulgata TaxID=6465 RepID=UPI0021805BA1|nr:HMG box-containing protein 4 [Patella vulgata]
MAGVKREREDDSSDLDHSDGSLFKRTKFNDGFDECKDDEMSDSALSSRTVGRVRKKSAKVLEMEEFEEAEKKQYKKPPDSNKKTTNLIKCSGSATKVKVKTEEIVATDPPENIPDSTTPPPKKPNKSSVIKLLLSSPAVPTVPSVSTKAVTKSKPEVHTEVESQGVTASTKKAIKSKVKVKDLTSPLPPNVKLEIETVEEVKAPTVSDLAVLSPTSAIYANMPDIASISPSSKNDGSLKMKLILSPKQENPTDIIKPEFSVPETQVIKNTKKPKKKKESPTNEPTSTSKSPSEAMPNLAALVNAAGNTANIKKKPQPKKKSKKNLEFEFETLGETMDSIDRDEEPQLVIVDPTQSTSKKKPVKKTSTGIGKIKKKVKTEPDLDGETLEGPVPPEGDLAALSAKVHKQVISKKKKMGSDILKKPKIKKNKRPPTAYTLWCNAHRTDVLKENPKMDFAQMSRRLGVIWQGLSKKEKLSWKRKAKKLAGKGSTLISTGKTKQPAQSQPLAAASAPTGVVISTTAKPMSPVAPVTKRNSAEEHLNITVPRGLGTDPVDVAAHLKLMGESLSIIGMRLQETKGHMAVQGGLSVLLDSLICACGPLMCLTQQVSELNGCDRNTHSKTLDNIAYIMPGL